MAALTQGPTGQSDGTPPQQAAEGTLGLSQATALISAASSVSASSTCLVRWRSRPDQPVRGGADDDLRRDAAGGREGWALPRAVRTPVRPRRAPVRHRLLDGAGVRGHGPVLHEVRRVDRLQHPGVHVRDHRRDPLRLLGAGPYQVARPGQPRDPHAPLRTRCHRRRGGDRVLRALHRLLAQHRRGPADRVPPIHRRSGVPPRHSRLPRSAHPRPNRYRSRSTAPSHPKGSPCPCTSIPR